MSDVLPISDEMRGFLLSIKQEPEDDTLRLIFADWLEERGDPRGALMRAQVESDSLSEYDSRLGPLQQTIRQHKREVESALSESPSWLELFDWQRGLLSIQIKRLASLPMRIQQMGRSDWPWEWTDRIQLNGFELNRHSSERFFQSPMLAHLNGLHFSRNRFGHDATKALTSSPHLKNLTELTILDPEMTSQAFELLVSAEALSQLKTLDLTNNERSSAESMLQEQDALDLPSLESLRLIRLGANSSELAGLVQTPTFSRLICAMLGGNNLGDEGMVALAQAEHSRLQYLNLVGCEIGREGADALAQSEMFQDLRHLHLGWNDLGDEGVESLARSQNLPELRSLDLPSVKMTDEGLSLLLTAPFIHQLTSLGLHTNQLSGAMLESLARCSGLSNLRELSITLMQPTHEQLRRFQSLNELSSLTTLAIRFSGINTARLAILLEAPSLARLQSLDLSGNYFAEGGAELLASSPAAASLIHLNLRYGRMGNHGAAALAGSPFLTNLISLDLRNNDLTDEAALALLESPHLKSLTHLAMDGELTNDVKSALEERFDVEWRD